MVNNKIAQRAVAAGLSGLMAFGAAAPAALAFSNVPFEFVDVNGGDNGTYWKRIGGKDRYETMKKIVESYNKIGYTFGYNLYGADTASYYNYHTTAVIASGDNFPDALAANGLAGYLTNMSLAGGWTDGSVPVILTKAGSLSSEAKDLLKNMQVQNVIIMGGTAAVSQDVEDAIAKLGIGVSRVAGKDRQETSVKALQRINGNWSGRKGTYDLIIATGANYADALSISPYAYRMGTPVVLTQADGTLTDQAVEAIKANDKIKEIIIVGGPESVKDSVMGQIGTIRDNKVGVNFTRLGGADRYETSAKIAEFEVNTWREFWKGGRFSFNHCIVATGENFPDALAGGQLAGGYWLPDRNVEDFSGLNAWSPSPLLLTKDGERTAEGTISKFIAAEGVTSNTSTYATQKSWNDTIKGTYGTATTTYTTLFDRWFGCTMYKYLSIKALEDAAAKAGGAYWEPGQTAATGHKTTFNVGTESVETITALKDAKMEYQTARGDTWSDKVELNIEKKAPTLSAWKPGQGLTLEVEVSTGAYPKIEITADEINKTPVENGKITITKKFNYDVHDSTSVRAELYTITLDVEQAKTEHVARVESPATDGTVITLVDYDKFNLKFADGTEKKDVVLDGKVAKLSDDKKTVTYDDTTAATSSQGWLTEVIGVANATDADFYGIILGGTDAVSNKKRDLLDEAVEYTAGTDNVTTAGGLTVTKFSEDWGVNVEYTRLVPMNQSIAYKGSTGLVFRIAATDNYVMWVYAPNAADINNGINKGYWVYVPKAVYDAAAKTAVTDDTLYGYNKFNPYNFAGI